jgi:hypothetical protein
MMNVKRSALPNETLVSIYNVVQVEFLFLFAAFSGE